MTDAENQTTTYIYDELGRKFQTTWPDHVAGSNPGDTNYGITRTTFDPAGRTLRTTDQLGDTVTYLYDLASRLTTREYRTLTNSPTGQTESTDTFTYDQSGRLLTAQKGRYNNTVTFAYDEAGRTITEDLTAHNTTYNIGNTYDDNGRLTSITYPDNTVVNRTYTNRDQLATVEQNNVTLAAMTYNNSGRETSRILGNGITTNYNYRNDGLLTAIDTVGISGADFVYTYDANKNLTSEIRDDNMAPYSFTATYDDQNRLVNWLRQNQESQAWNLTPVGDWTNTTTTDTSNNTNTETRTHGQTHELATINGNPLIHDVKGNLTQDHTNKSFTWDVDNHLKSATVPANSTEGIVGTHTYEYDALGRRVAKIVNDVTNNLTNWTLYISRTEPIAYSPFAGQTLMEYQWTSGQAAAVIRKFTYGYYIDEPITLTDKRVGADNTYYYHRNRQFSTVAMTNTTGTIIERYTYTAYGKPTCYDATGNTLTTSLTGNETTYTGRQSDQETGLMYFRARYYSTSTGGFISRDPLHYVDGASLYLSYFLVDGVDPSGLIDQVDRLPIAPPIDYEHPTDKKPGVFVENSTSVYGLHKRICVTELDQCCNVSGYYCITFGGANKVSSNLDEHCAGAGAGVAGGAITGGLTGSPLPGIAIGGVGGAIVGIQPPSDIDLPTVRGGRSGVLPGNIPRRFPNEGDGLVEQENRTNKKGKSNVLSIGSTLNVNCCQARRIRQEMESLDGLNGDYNAVNSSCRTFTEGYLNHLESNLDMYNTKIKGEDGSCKQNQ